MTNTSNVHKNSNLKLSIRITFMDNFQVRFEFLHLCDEVYKYSRKIFYRDKYGYELVKNSKYFSYDKERLIFPDYTLKNYENYENVFYYYFINNKDRYESLKKLSKTFEGFSKTAMFKNNSYNYDYYKKQVVYCNEYWFVY